MIVRMAIVGALCIGLGACGSGKDVPAAVKPATAELLAHETELLKLTLTAAAEIRLGILTVQVVEGTAVRTIKVQGEIVVPTGGGGMPISAQTDMVLLAASQARADGEVARARAEVAQAQKAAARAAALAQEQAGSGRADEEAQTALAVAEANLRVAQTQRAQLGNTPTALGENAELWVRAAAFASDLTQVDRRAVATVHNLGATGAGISARPVTAPPSANTAGTVDLYYALSDQKHALRVGQRVAVDLPTRDQSTGLVVPTTAILNDIHGGEWVYVRTGEHAFERRRIEVAANTAGQALLRRGLAVGDSVVTAGSAELFGTEFGAK